MPAEALGPSSEDGEAALNAYRAVNPRTFVAVLIFNRGDGHEPSSVDHDHGL